MVQFARTTISLLIDDMAKIFMIAFQKVKLDPVMHGDINTQICEVVEILGKGRRFEQGNCGKSVWEVWI